MAWNPAEFNLRSNPNRELWDQSAIPFDLSGGDLDASIDSVSKCSIKIIPCDEDWNEQKEFASTEKIFVKVEITNVTDERVLVHLGMLGPGFGRDGIQVELASFQRGSTTGAGIMNNYCVPIGPGETYTVWRHLTAGDKPSRHCAFRTPQKPGTYILKAQYYRKYFAQTTEIEVVQSLPEEDIEASA